MHYQSETAVFNACRILFGDQINLSREFLNYLQPSGARTAFRNQAKANHPDSFAGSSPQVRKQQTERFREIRHAYDVITAFLDKRRNNRLQTSASASSPATAPWGRRSTRQRTQQKPHPRASSIPAIQLEFGMFLYYQGKITYQQLIEALVWQRRQRPTLGVIACKWGWLSEARVAQILGHRGQTVRFGKKAVELGYLRPHQVEALLRHQRSLQKRIGHYFIAKGWLTEEEAEQISQSLETHNGQINLRVKNLSNI